MARPRLQLHQLLKAMLPEGSQHVYFQPAANISMQYPCIVYKRDYADTKFADNLPYQDTKRYQVTVIDADPDSLIPDKVKQLPYSSFQRFFVVDQLNHDIYNVYF